MATFVYGYRQYFPQKELWKAVSNPPHTSVSLWLLVDDLNKIASSHEKYCYSRASSTRHENAIISPSITSYLICTFKEINLHDAIIGKEARLFMRAQIRL